MQSTITVVAKVLGQKDALGHWPIPAPAGRITLRELITRVVLEEVKAFRARQEERRLYRLLTEAEIEEGAAQGKVDPGGHGPAPAVDPRAAVEAALQAFEDGLYFVFVGAEQQLELDAAVTLAPGAQVTFVRLVALAGG